MSLGENIFKQRTNQNWSQTDLANELNVSRQSVSKWENNTAVPDLDKLIKMKQIFEVSIDELVFGETSKEISNEKGNNISTNENTNDIKEIDNNTYVTIYRQSGEILTIELEEYLRQTEKADHSNWNDINNYNIVARIQTNIQSKINARFFKHLLAIIIKA